MQGDTAHSEEKCLKWTEQLWKIREDFQSRLGKDRIESGSKQSKKTMMNNNPSNEWNSAVVEIPAVSNQQGPAVEAGAATKQAFQSFSDAVQTAKQNAAEQARSAGPKVKQAVSGVAYDLAYGAAFGACFAAAFTKEFVPGFVKDGLKSVKDGLTQGSKAGTTTGETVAQDLTEAVQDVVAPEVASQGTWTGNNHGHGSAMA